MGPVFQWLSQASCNVARSYPTFEARPGSKPRPPSGSLLRVLGRQFPQVDQREKSWSSIDFYSQELLSKKLLLLFSLATISVD